MLNISCSLWILPNNSKSTRAHTFFEDSCRKSADSLINWNELKVILIRFNSPPMIEEIANKQVCWRFKIGPNEA